MQEDAAPTSGRRRKRLAWRAKKVCALGCEIHVKALARHPASSCSWFLAEVYSSWKKIGLNLSRIG
jgi:hypothetical protein